MPHAQCIDEAFERDFPPRGDGAEQVAHRNLTEAFHVFELDLGVPSFEREDIARLLDPALLEEQFDLLLAQTVDIEGAAGHEMPQVLDLLIGAGEFAGAARPRALLSSSDHLADDVRLEGTWTFLGELIGL